MASKEHASALVQSKIAARLAVYGSSVAADLRTQLQFMEEEGISRLELGTLGGRSLVDVPSEEIDALARASSQAGVQVFALRTDIGLGVEPAEADRERLTRYVHLARRLGSSCVLIQTYWQKSESDARDRFALVCAHFRRLFMSVAPKDITFCVRNLAGTTCETSLDLLRLIDAVGASHLCAVFDPGNAALVGEVAYGDGFPLLAPCLAYIHARDFDPGAGIFVPPGEGVCQWTRMLGHLKDGGLRVPLCLDFSMTSVGGEEGTSSATRARAGTLALKRLLRRFVAVSEEEAP
jgi:sugar phosphate isomerase/epimerase